MTAPPFLRRLRSAAGDELAVEATEGAVVLFVRERPVARLTWEEARRLGCWLVLGAHEVAGR